MVSMWEAVFLGIVQGATEFLPISSSAHLVLFALWMRENPAGLTFDLMLHVGTLGAVLIYFRKEWKNLAIQLVRLLFASKKETSDFRLAAALFWGTLPALLAGALFEGVIEHTLRRPGVIAVTLAGFGLLLVWADRRGRCVRNLSGLGRRDALLIGAAQALALVPGVSRSGITITAGLLLGFSRGEAARFAFLLTVPVITAAALWRARLLFVAGLPSWNDPGTLTAGMIASLISGFLCIGMLLRFLKAGSYLPFAVYRLLLASFICVWLAW